MEQLIAMLNKYCKPKINKLNIKGEIGDINAKRVGIVGSRRMTAYGRDVVKDLCAIMVRQGITVVSGLMYGVDLEAHKQILLMGGRTIGVLGYGFNRLPGYAAEIANLIMSQNSGAIISEFEDDQPAALWTFPRRNRIVAALSDYVVIVEAGKDSGTLITADLALEMGREVYVVCGSIYSEQSYGCNRLLGEGATPLYDLKILEEDTESNQDYDHSVKIPLNLSLSAESVFNYISSQRYRLPVDKFEVMKNTLGSVNELNIALSELELNNLIEIAGDNIRLN